MEGCNKRSELTRLRDQDVTETGGRGRVRERGERGDRDRETKRVRVREIER